MLLINPKQTQAFEYTAHVYTRFMHKGSQSTLFVRTLALILSEMGAHAFFQTVNINVVLMIA